MAKMNCTHQKSDVTDSRKRFSAGLQTTYRRRKCRKCGHVWSTGELDLEMLDKLIDFVRQIGRIKLELASYEQFQRAVGKRISEPEEQSTDVL